MQKVVILGCPGSGKSTFARRLYERTGLPLVHLDQIWWQADHTHITREAFDAQLERILQTDAWILDGHYRRTIERRLQACDTVFVLDYGEEVCMAGAHARIGTPRADMPWVEEALDPELAAFVQRFNAEERPRLMELLQQYQGIEQHVFHTRAECDAWLDAFHQKKNSLAERLC